jgi:hypothetical protein
MAYMEIQGELHHRILEIHEDEDLCVEVVKKPKGRDKNKSRSDPSARTGVEDIEMNR